MISVSMPMIVDEPQTPFGLPARRLHWPDDGQANLYFVLKGESAYVLGIQRGATLTGTEILRAFQSVAEGRRVKAVGVGFDSIGFWEKMVERQLVGDWCLDDPASLIG